MDAWMMGGLLAPDGSASVPIDVALLRLLVTGLCAWAMGAVYSRTHGALSYSQNFVQALVLLALVVCFIMGVVGDSLSRAFGLAAALAVVRFRTPVKDARDTTFLFMAVAAGMGCGTGQLLFSGLTTAVVLSAVFILEWTAYGSRVDSEGVLRFRFAGEEEGRPSLDAVLRKHARSFRLTGARRAGPSQPEELVYDISMRDDAASLSLVKELSEVAHVTAVSLLPTARVGEA